MTKQKIMETYTAEQLAEMVENNSKKHMVNNAHALLFDLVTKLKDCGIDVKARGDYEYSKDCTSLDFVERISEIDFSEHDKEFTDKIEELQSEVERYRKSFKDAKKERDFQIAEYQKKICELTAENEKLKGNVGSKGYCDKQNKTNNFYGLFANHAKDLTKDDMLIFLGVLAKELIANGVDFCYEMENEPKVWDIKIKRDKDIADFLPTEPIKVADMLINASKKRANCMTGKEYDKYIFEKWQLRQIAEHLLVYCNHNGKVEE